MLTRKAYTQIRGLVSWQAPTRINLHPASGVPYSACRLPSRLCPLPFALCPRFQQPKVAISQDTQIATLFHWFHFRNTVLLISLSQHSFTDFTFTTVLLISLSQHIYWFHFHDTVLLISFSQQLISLSQHCFTDFTLTTLFYWFHFHNTFTDSLSQHFHWFHFHNTHFTFTTLF